MTFFDDKGYKRMDIQMARYFYKDVLAHEELYANTSLATARKKLIDAALDDIFSEIDYQIMMKKEKAEVSVKNIIAKDVTDILRELGYQCGIARSGCDPAINVHFVSAISTLFVSGWVK